MALAKSASEKDANWEGMVPGGSVPYSMQWVRVCFRYRSSHLIWYQWASVVVCRYVASRFCGVVNIRAHTVNNEAYVS